MSGTYYALVTIHLFAALLWLGGMFFFGIIGAPVIRAMEPAELRQRLFHALGTRFRTVGWVCIGMLIVTGVLMLHVRGLLQWSGVLDSGAFWRTDFGTSLAVKLAAVLAMTTMSLIHDFRVGPAATRAAPGSPLAAALRRRAALLARATAFVGVILVLAAVRLARA